jgi:hypothetical protein
MPSPNTYQTGSVFTVKQEWGNPLRHAVVPGPEPTPAYEAWFHVAVVQFEDDGTATDPSQLQAARQAILASRRSGEDGSIVVVFIHGWHHNAAWNRTPSTLATTTDGDEHFHSFRLLLESLALRERERPHWRRVVGVYIGWNGDPVEGTLRHLSGAGILTHGSFWNRYPVAERIGACAAFQETLRTIITTTKEPLQAMPGEPAPSAAESPLIMIGHSMGALMLESGLLALLEDERRLLVRPAQSSNVGAVRLESHQGLVWFPDLILALNSATDSRIARSIQEALAWHQLEKTASSSTGRIRFAPPIIMSVTSTGDTDTRDMWRAAQGIFAPWRKTDGHDTSLFTHDFVQTQAQSVCNKRPNVPDFGQNWHCLRIPTPAVGIRPAIPVDLPTRDRHGVEEQEVPHARYTLTPRGDANERRLLWVFQVPPAVIKDHNDIFNSKARSLILALIQVSGAVASLAEDWGDSFEPE